MSEWEITYAPQAREDWLIVKDNGLSERVRCLIQLIRDNPFCSPPPYRKLDGELTGAYSRRITQKHRLVYQVIEDQTTVKILACWKYDDD
jgi:Txe/YoeB family toxin of toxin-antitoxin system